MTRELQVHIGDSLDSMGQRFIDAWNRAERGDLTEDTAERHAGRATTPLQAQQQFFQNQISTANEENRQTLEILSPRGTPRALSELRPLQ